MSETPPDEATAPEQPSYEQARDELVQVVQRLEGGGIALEEQVALWERGEELASICQRHLDGARSRLDAVMSGRDEPRPEPGAGADDTSAG